jgi:hypothetical protein
VRSSERRTPPQFGFGNDLRSRPPTLQPGLGRERKKRQQRTVAPPSPSPAPRRPLNKRFAVELERGSAVIPIDVIGGQQGVWLQ